MKDEHETTYSGVEGSAQQQIDGGQAFPATYPGDPRYAGMTLRDWFAGGIIAQLATDKTIGNALPRDVVSSSEKLRLHLAKMAYALADAMIKVRGK